MNKEKLLALAKSLGITVDESMTIAEIEAAILAYTSNNTIAADAALASAEPEPVKAAESIFNECSANTVSTFTGYKIMLINRTSKPDRRRILVRRGDKYFNVYTYSNIVEDSGAKIGMQATIVAELHTPKGSDKPWWNCTGIIPE